MAYNFPILYNMVTMVTIMHWIIVISDTTHIFIIFNGGKQEKEISYFIEPALYKGQLISSKPYISRSGLTVSVAEGVTSSFWAH